MTDSLGWRMKFAVIAPSTNTSVQPEYEDMRPVGVTNHFCRIPIPDTKGTLVAIVCLSFVTQLSTFATFAGLLSAGLAVAMQSVLVSVVGYFFLIGKYGIRVGDRVQVEPDGHGDHRARDLAGRGQAVR